MPIRTLVVAAPMGTRAGCRSCHVLHASWPLVQPCTRPTAGIVGARVGMLGVLTPVCTCMLIIYTLS